MEIKNKLLLSSLTAILTVHLISAQQYDITGDYKIGGNLGIGITSPLSKLHIVDGTGVLRTNDNGDGIILTSYDHLKSIGLSSSSNGNYGGTGAVGLKLINGEVKYYFGSYEKVTFKSDGKVGIGTNSPSAQLEVQQSGEGSFIMKSLAQGAYGAANIIVDAATGFPGRFLFRENGVNKGWISYDGNGNMINFRNSNPTSLLSIKMDNGRVGIGTSSPAYQLHLKDPSGGSALGLERNGKLWRFDLDYTEAGKLYISHTDKSNILVLSRDGNIGIGTANPDTDSKLTVAGKIHAREVKVTVNAGADHVFKNHYQLPDLEKLETFIHKNKHLPEIAPEQEMLENGVEVGGFQIKLLQKIEELTLYIIDQNKSLKEVMQKNQKLEERIKTLEK